MNLPGVLVPLSDASTPARLVVPDAAKPTFAMVSADANAPASDGTRPKLAMSLDLSAVPLNRSVRRQSATTATPASAPSSASSTRQAGGRAAALAKPETLLLEVTINGQSLKEVVHAELAHDGKLLLPIEAWAAARLAPLGKTRTLSDGTAAYAVDDITAATHRIDRSALTVRVDAPAGAFVNSNLIGQSAATVVLSNSEPGVMVNYDLSILKSPDTGNPAAAATLEAIMFNQYGSFVTSGVVRNSPAANLSVGRDAKVISRLDSYWRYDMPDRLQTVVIGDTVGVSGGWSRPARFGGVRWGRDFGMRPGFVTFPQIALTGEAALPSTVEVLVNNARTLSQTVAPGPFSLSNVPLVTGAGELNLVVRDLLGRETVVKQSYYASPRLLAPDINDFSFEAGWLRTGYGGDSRYTDPFVAGTVRAGLTDRLTGEGRLEVQPNRQAVGLELAGLLGDWAVARIALAASSGHTQGPSERGQLAQAGIERSSAKGGASLQYEYASRGFAPFAEGVGTAVPDRRARERWIASAGGILAGSVSGGVNFVKQTRWDGEHLTSAGLSLSATIWRGLGIGVQVNKRFDSSRSWTAGLNVNVSLDQGFTTSVRSNRDASGQISSSVLATQTPPPGPGLGWRAEVSTLPSQMARGGVQYITSQSEFELDVASDRNGRITSRGGSRGTFGWLAGAPFFSRPVGDGAVAMVEVGGVAGVPVMRAHQVVAVTDSQGRAFIPQLLPWQANQIEIDPSDLPLDVEVNEVVQQVTPHARSGARVTFDIRRTRQALVALQLADGQPVPMGARVRMLPGGAEFVAGRRGEVWLTDLGTDMQRITVQWKSGFCDVSFAVPPASADNTLGKIGPLTCDGKTP